MTPQMTIWPPVTLKSEALMDGRVNRLNVFRDALMKKEWALTTALLYPDPPLRRAAGNP